MPDPALARLTENEKICLRRRLLPQTAKEMAIDLGISPHAVEKRLKMARAKLGQKREDVPSRKVGMDEAVAFIKPGFHQKDADRSGSLNAREASAMEPRDRFRDASLPSAPPAGNADPAAERKWMKLLDNDGDGKVSEDEYVRYMLPWTLWTGVPADWHPIAAGTR